MVTNTDTTGHAARERLARIGVRLLERAVLTVALSVAVVAAIRIPALLTMPEMAAPIWWPDWIGIPSGSAFAGFTGAMLVAGWAQYALARRRMGRR